MSLNDFILDGIRWSYSSVNTYDTCPQAFRLGYLDALPREGNAFSDWGTFMHSLMERYFCGELEFFELSQIYSQEYKDYVTNAFPPNKFCSLEERYYKAGKEYLDQFDGAAFEKCDVVAVEQRVNLDIGGRPFVGVIDLLIKDGDDYIIIDHKSKSAFKSKKECAEYARQLYLYANYVKEKYGDWPTKLEFHMVRDNGKLIEVPFDEYDAEEARQWFIKTIDMIYQDDKFESTPNKIRRQLKELSNAQSIGEVGFKDYLNKKKKLESDLSKTGFFCWQLCSNRSQCPNKDKGPKE